MMVAMVPRPLSRRVAAVVLVLLLVISDALRTVPRLRARMLRSRHSAACAPVAHRLALRAATSSEPPGSPDLSTQFDVWEAEEMEEQRREAEEAVLAAQASGTEDELPEYMLRLLQQFDDHGSLFDDSPPVQASRLPIIAVIGRPNTGKSTIVNRLSNSFKDGAIVHDEPGITRDRTYRVGMWNDFNFQVVDTGGIVFDDVEDIFADKITQQALLALGEATAAMMVCDGKEGVNPLDLILADWLRKNNKVPLYLAVNKCESETQGIAQAQDFWSLGLGTPYPVSGIHGTGLGDLLDEITVTHLTKVTKVQKENATNIAFIGRPNVGKSSLFNRLLGVDRAIVSDIAGTTRDTVDALVHRGDATYRIVDTAGVRKKGKIEYGAEFFMVNRAFKAVKRAEVVVLLLGMWA
jgi:small GTP-binding protein